MSLIFDALRHDPGQPVREPTRTGSVVSGKGHSVLWLIVAACMLVLVALVSMRLPDAHSGHPLAEPSAQAAPGLAGAGETPPRLSGEVLTRPAGTAAPSASVASRGPAQVPASSAASRRAALPETPADPRPAPSPTLPVDRAVAGEGASRSSTHVFSASGGRDASRPEAPSPVSPAVLLSAFNGAMADGQRERARALLHQARLALGDEHLLVARMEGYYCMRADCVERARRAYTAILSRLPHDREAGYNLALIDWQAARTGAARERIRGLLVHYPSDEALRALQRLVEGRR